MGRPFKAIVVGIEKYDDAQAWKALDGVEAMAARVARAFGAEPLTLPEGGRKAEAPRALKDAIGTLPERGTLLVHWIGHGVTVDQHYLVCRDSPRPAQLDGYEAIPSGELGRMIANSRAERVVVVLDTCFSGEGGGNLAQRYRDSLARELDREGWQRVACVIAASHPLDKAVAGRFSQGMVDVLENPDRHLKWSKADAYIDPERLAVAIQEMLGEENKAVHPRFEKSGLGQDIIPNPHYRPMSGTEDIETRRHLEAVFGEQAHFNLAARGIEAGEAGFYFTGRRQSQSQVIEWLNGGYSNLMVVTGPPGSGKSALIGRIVTLTVPELREQLRTEGALHENDPVPSENAIDIAIHAKGKSVFQVATSLGRAIKLKREVTDQPGIVDVLERMKAESGRRTIVIDALDEAASGQAERIANEIIRPLVAMSSVRVLVGTRRSLDGALVPEGEERHGRLIKAFGADATVRDLADEPETDGDIAEYVARRLRASMSRGSDAWITEAGRMVAAAADGSFLYARLVARSLEAFPDAPLDRLPAGAAAAFAQDIASRFSGDQRRVMAMLRALAFGLGRGLSRAVWAPIASALAEDARTYSDDDVVWMLRHVGSYIVETTVDTDGIGQAVYRLIHQALADYLQREPHDAHRRIVGTITHGLEGVAWLTADQYLRRHLLEHAVLGRVEFEEPSLKVVQMPPNMANAEAQGAAGGELACYGDVDNLFRNPAVLAISEPAVVLAMGRHLFSPEARRAFGMCQLAGDRLFAATPSERWSLLHLTGLIQGDQAWTVASKPSGAAGWQGVWSRTLSSTQHLLVRAHEDGVSSVTLGFINRRAIVVSGGNDGTVRMWDAENGMPVGVAMTGHEGSVESVGFDTVNGRALIVSGGSDGTVRLWDAENGTPVRAAMTGHEGRINSVTLGTVNDRTRIVSGGEDGTVRLWDAEDGIQIGARIRQHEGKVCSVALGTFNGQARIVSAGYDGTVQQWDAVTGRPVGAPITGHEGGVCSVALWTVKDRSLIVSGGYDGTVRWWDADNGMPVGVPRTDHLGVVASVALGVVNDRALIVSGGSDGTVRLWDADNGTPLGAPMTEHGQVFMSVALGTVNGRARIVSGGRDGTMRLWDVSDGMSVGAPIVGHRGGVESVALGTVNGRVRVVSGGEDGTVRQWDAEDGTPVDAVRVSHGRVESVALGPVNGQPRIVSAGSDGKMLLFDAADRTLVGVPMMMERGRFCSVALGNVRGRALIVSGGTDRMVRRWNAEDGMAIGEPMIGHEGWVNSVSLGVVNGRARIVSGGDDRTVRQWDAESGTPIGVPINVPTYQVLSVALGTVNGRALIVSGDYDGSVRLWNAEDGSPVGALMAGHVGRVQSVALGAVNGGARIVSGGSDGTVRLWNAETSLEILSVPIGSPIASVVLVGQSWVCAGCTKGIVMLHIRI